jgi:DNA-directed RNA polymerase specialized sigma24 family protein
MHHKGKRWDPNRLPFRNPWFFSILRRVALSMVRKQAQFQFRFKGHSPSEWAHNINPAFITERRDTEETVHASIKELRPRDALFILAVFFNGTIDPSISPAGRHMGLHRAKQRLRKILMRRGIEGPC